MPNRILKDTFRLSEKVNGLTDFQFRLWVSLITYVDDYGRGDARPAVIKGYCFPLRDRVTIKDIDAALQALAGAGCVGLYTVDGKPYLYFPRWESHQSIRNKKSRFPAPNAENSKIEINCNQLNASVPVIQSNPNPNPTAQNVRDGEFALFWSAYPKKVGESEAKKAFFKTSVPVDELIHAISVQKRSEQWTKDNGKYIPNPSTWLNQCRWEDEITVSGKEEYADDIYAGLH